MQPTFAAFNFKSSSNDRIDGHRVHWKKILTHADSLQAWTPKKEKCFHPHGLGSLTCLVSMRKEEQCI